MRQVLLESISPARQRLLRQRLTSIDEAAASGQPRRLAGRVTQMDATRDLIAGTVFEYAAEAGVRDGPASTTASSPPTTPAAPCSATRARSCSRRRSRCIHPAELPELSELLERVLRDGRASTIKLTCRTKHGTFLPTEISLHALELGGRLRILGLVQDRSEHRQRDRRLSRRTAAAQPPPARSRPHFDAEEEP